MKNAEMVTVRFHTNVGLDSIGKESDMFISIWQRMLPFLVVFILLPWSAAAAADNRSGHRVETGNHQQVDGIDIYIGVVPARIAGEHQPTHEERKMHGGAPAGKDDYHLVVALFDANGKRITDAEVSATMAGLGMSGPRKTLQPMQIGETTSFGNYFRLRGKGIYRIDIEIRRLWKHKPEAVRALFDYRLP